MKKVFSCLIISLIVLNSAFSQTEVEGTFFSDVTWTAAESPYHIVGNVQMGGSAILTIEPGVVVKYTGPYEIFVDGGIQINGTAEDSVVFEPLEGGQLETTLIRFLNADLSDSQINYARIEGADNLLLVDDECEQTIDINNSLFKNGAFQNGDATTGNHGIILVEDCVFNNAQIICRNRGELVLSQCAIYDSYIRSYSSRYDPQLIGIVIDSSNLFNSTLVADANDRSLLCENSFISECSFSADYTIFMFHDCKIINSRFYDYVDWNDWSHFFELESCILKNTSVESNTTSSENSWYTSLEMENCIVVKGSSTIFGCYQFDFINSVLIGDSLSLGVLMEKGEIYNSTIIDNEVGLRIKDSGNNTSVVGSNLFRNLTYNVELENVSQSVSGVNNYWGSANPNEISESIYDVYDDVSLGLVDFDEYLEEPHVNCPISPPIGLSANSTGQGLQLTWHPNPEPDVAGYRFHYGNFDGFEFENVMDMGSDTTFLVPFFVATDSLAITAYDNQLNDNSPIFNSMTSGHESWYSSIIITDVLTGFSESQSTGSQDVRVFPNPVKEVLMIELGDPKKIVSDFKIFDSKGKIVQQGSLNNTSQMNINVSSLINGSYLIELVYDNEVSTSKFVKM